MLDAMESSGHPRHGRGQVLIPRYQCPRCVVPPGYPVRKQGEPAPRDNRWFMLPPRVVCTPSSSVRSATSARDLIDVAAQFDAQRLMSPEHRLVAQDREQGFAKAELLTVVQGAPS